MLGMPAHTPTPAPDNRWMQQALSLARTGLGHVWPNPSVGCVIVQGEEVVGHGRTARRGRPHAEVLALREAGDAARGATAYVTLEPCAHWGHTPPCTDALLAAGVSRVVIALVDPDPRTNGRGIQRLREHGVQVEVGLGEADAADVNRGFFHRVRSGRPIVGVTASRGDALARLAPQWDAVGAHPALPGTLTPCGISVSVEGLSLSPGTWWVPAPGQPDRADAAVNISLPDDAIAEDDRLPMMLAALGQQGLTRLLLHQDDPLAAALRAAGLIDLVI